MYTVDINKRVCKNSDPSFERGKESVKIQVIRQNGY